MEGWHGGRLTAQQNAFAGRFLDTPGLVEDMSWGLVDTAVLHVRDGHRELVVKAAGPQNHHIGREITAHETATRLLVEEGLTPRLVAADRAANLLITEYLPGRLVEGTPSELDPEVHHQAGAILARLHRSAGIGTPDTAYEADAAERLTRWLRSEHRIAAEAVQRIEAILASWRPVARSGAPTHGDFQPRNWLIADGRVLLIDYGRFAPRPAATDLCRLATQQWRGRPDLEEAFLEGYGADPREEPAWSMDLLRDAVGTAAWAYQVGDEAFEQQGHRMIAEALARPVW